MKRRITKRPKKCVREELREIAFQSSSGGLLFQNVGCSRQVVLSGQNVR